MSGGGSTTTTETENETKLSEELRGSSVNALTGAENLYNQGTSGIYQGSQLADENALIGQAQQGLMNQYGADGALSGLVNTGTGQLQNMLMSGDLENNSIFQQQMADILEESGVQFGRQAVPLMQRASAAGQYGGSEGMEGLGLLGGEIDRNTQQALTKAALGQQQIALQAQGLIPAALQSGERGYDVMGQIGGQRAFRSQQELQDQINQFNAPRNAEMQNLQQFYSFLGSNPLMAESNFSGTETQTVKNEGDPFGAILGAGLAIAGMPATGGGSLGGNFLSGLGGGGGGGAGGGMGDLSTLADRGGINNFSF